MNELQNINARVLEKQGPGCLGRMVNVFDPIAGFPRNRLLTDKPHDDCSLSRTQSDVTRISSPVGDEFDDMLVMSELRRNSSIDKVNRTPMKMLIAQEMSKEVRTTHNSPNLVAKLMGLEALPRRLPDSAAQGNNSKSHSPNTQVQAALRLGCPQGDHEVFDKQRHQMYHSPEQNDFKDVYEIWQQPEKANLGRDSPRKGTNIEETYEKKMALIRQKFTEAKRLSTDEKLRQSKEFQDALELLNSNRELLIKFLQEPNSMFSQHLYDMRSSPSSQATRRITVLRPSKTVSDGDLGSSQKSYDRQTKKIWACQEIGQDKSNHPFPPAYSCMKAEESPTFAQTTRIVVLKSCPGKNHDIKAMNSLPSSSPRISNDEDLCGQQDIEVQESMEVAKEITNHMHETVCGHRRDETLLSSVFSNGYIGDESSFNKSEIFEVGNLSDSEFMSPSSRHSWDHINRFESPYSCSSLSRASFSPESSVCREAKKRLSERWAMMASNGCTLEPKHARRSSSTLGEMLDLPDMKKSVTSDEGRKKEQDMGQSSAFSTSKLDRGEGSPRNLLRSKSLPGSSTTHGDRLTIEISDADNTNMNVSKQLTKSKSAKSSFKGKVSSFFFSRNKKSSKGKFSWKDESQPGTTDATSTQAHPSSIFSCEKSPRINETDLKESVFPHLRDAVEKASCPELISLELRHGIVCEESELNRVESGRHGNPTENLDQPSPISVLVPPFEEEDSTTPEFSNSIKNGQQGIQMPLRPARPNLIDKSPPIEPMARRALSWDDYSAQLATQHILKQHSTSPQTEEKEKDWLQLVQSVLLAAGLDTRSQSNSLVRRWHSPDSPLSPVLREKYVSLGDKGFMHEAKRRQWRSNRKLVFDCVNVALADIICESKAVDEGGDGSLQGPWSVLVDLVWNRTKEWCISEVAGDSGDIDSVVVERVVRMEVVGGGWLEGRQMEADKLGQELGGNLLEELLEEAVVELTGRV